MRVRVPDRPNGRDDIVAALTGSYLFGALPGDVIAALAATATVRRLSRNEALFEPGDVADEIYQPERAAGMSPIVVTTWAG